MHQIDKETKIFGSIGSVAGNKGCFFFNRLFETYSLNAIYKSFSSDDIFGSLNAARKLNFSGCAIASPFKSHAFHFCEVHDEGSKLSRAVNTVVFDKDSGKSCGFNTDFYAAGLFFDSFVNGLDHVYILGYGGLAQSVSAAAKIRGVPSRFVTRKNWDSIGQIEKSIIFNCTPVQNVQVCESNTFIDCLIGTKSGDLFYQRQANKQFEIYTGIKNDR
jgi:shikimate dehydrogenase